MCNEVKHCISSTVITVVYHQFRKKLYIINTECCIITISECRGRHSLHTAIYALRAIYTLWCAIYLLNANAIYFPFGKNAKYALTGNFILLPLRLA